MRNTATVSYSGRPSHAWKRLSVPCNWDPELLDLADECPDVGEFYGKPRVDIVGGGRAPYGLPEVDWRDMETFIGLCRQRGVSFNFLVNSLCLGNKEYDNEFMAKLLRYIERVVEIGADKATVSIPYLARVIKKQFPTLKLSVSKFADIRSVRQAIFWEELGADEITFSGNVTRNFEVLERMVQAVRIQTRLLVNDACLWNCHLQNYHHLSESHASQEDCTVPYFRYCTMNCKAMFLLNPAEIVRSTFVRPEDLGDYRRLGIQSFKLCDRNRPTAWIRNAVRAYSRETYDGNLADLLGLFSTYGEESAGHSSSRRLFVRAGDLEEIQKLQERRQGLEARISIDNQALEGFVEGFKRRDCERLICDSDGPGGCTYCQSWAEKAVRISGANKAMAALTQMVDALESRDSGPMATQEEANPPDLRKVAGRS